MPAEELAAASEPERASASWQRSALAVLAIRVAAAGCAYLAQVLMARLMGGAEYGVFATAWVWIAVLGHASSWGFAQGASRFVPVYRTTNDGAHLRGFLAAGLLVALASGGGAALLGAGALSLGALGTEAAPLALALLVLPLFALQDYAEGVARAFGWPNLAIAPPYLVRQVLIVAGMAAAMLAGAPPRAEVAVACVFAATGLAVALQGAILLARLRRSRPHTPPRRAWRWREWWRTALPLALSDLTISGFNFVDVLVLGLFEPPAAVGAYFAATRLLQLVVFVQFAASAATLPRFAEARARGDHEGLARLVRRRARLATSATLGVGLAILCASPWLLAWFGPGFGAGAPLLAVLLLGVLAQAALGPAEDLLAMLGEERLCAGLILASLLLAAGLNLVLVPLLGPAGAALAMALAWTGRGVALALAAQRRLGIVTPVVSLRPARADAARGPA